MAEKSGSIGADTSFLIDFLNGEQNAIEFMRTYGRLLHVSELVVFEFLCGKLNDKQQEKFLQFAQSFTVIPFDRSAALESSALFRKAKHNGTSVSHPDCMIAGSYLSQGITSIVTRNKNHFSQLSGITVIQY